MAILASRYLGRISFLEGRRIQEDLVQKRLAEQIPDTILFCEHPPTLSLGWRTKSEDANTSAEFWSARGVEMVRANRGGSATYHGPGQLVIYPVVSLRARGIGVKRFVQAGLNAIAGWLGEQGVRAVERYDAVGIWVPRPDGAGPGAKICSIGLKIEHGVTNHGFSVNVAGDLSVFRLFHPCGLREAAVTSVEAETGRRLILEEVAEELFQKLDLNLRRGEC